MANAIRSGDRPMNDDGYNRSMHAEDDEDSCGSDHTRGTSNVQMTSARSLAAIDDEEPLQPYSASISGARSVMTDDMSSLGQHGVEDYSVGSSRYSRVTAAAKSSDTSIPASALGSYKLHDLDDMVLEEDEDEYDVGDERSRGSKESKRSKTSKSTAKSTSSGKSNRSENSSKSARSMTSGGSRQKQQSFTRDALNIARESDDSVTPGNRSNASSTISGQNSSSKSSGSTRPSGFNYQSDSTMPHGNDTAARKSRYEPARHPPLTSFQRPSVRSQESVSSMSSFGLSTATPATRTTSKASMGMDAPSVVSWGKKSLLFGGDTTVLSDTPPNGNVEQGTRVAPDDGTTYTAHTNDIFFGAEPELDVGPLGSETGSKGVSGVSSADDRSASTMKTNRAFFNGDEGETLGETIGDTYANSTRSAGWSRYNGDEDVSTIGTNQEFFERALPYQSSEGQSRGTSKKATPSERSSPAGSTFRTSVGGKSDVSVGWDDKTMSTLDTKKQFFERALPWKGQENSQASGRRESPNSRTHHGKTTPLSTMQNTAYYEEDGTIMTDGTGYWQSSTGWSEPEKSPRDSATVGMSTIHEDTIATSDTRSDSYTFSSKPGSPGQYDDGEYSIYSGSSRKSSASVCEGGVDRPTGVFMRASHRQNSDPRKALSREVEVSMNGFLHQVKPLADDTTVASTFSGMQEQGEEVDRAPWDKSNGFFHRMMTLCSLSALVATAVFFASQIGPFQVQPNANGRATSQLAAEGSGNSTSTSQQSALATENNVENFPHNLQQAYMDWATPYGGPSKELPTLWTFDMSGSEFVQQIFGQCLSRTQAGNGLELDTTGSAVYAWGDDVRHLRIMRLQGQKFVNVDLQTIRGIERAADLGLAEARVAEVAYSPLLQTSTRLFYNASAESVTPQPVHGRLMIIFRDPILRAINRFEMLKLRTQDNELTLKEFASSVRFGEHNPLTRALIGVSSEVHLSESLLDTAKEVVRRKVLVGLLDRVDETLVRWETYFSWYVGDELPSVASCHIDVLNGKVPEYRIQMNYREAEPKGYNYLLAQHRMDIEVVRFATELYEEQGRTLFPQGLPA